MDKLIETYRPAWILGALTLVFWTIWDAATGGLSQLSELKITMDWVVEYPFVISRYWDAALVFVCAAGLVTITRLFKAIGAENMFLWEIYLFEVVSLACGILLTIPLFFAPSQSIASIFPFLLVIVPTLWLAPLLKSFPEWIEKLSYSIVVCLNSTFILAILFTWVRGAWVGLATLAIGIALTLPYIIISRMMFYRFLRSQR